jgi:hypothetical protein
MTVDPITTSGRVPAFEAAPSRSGARTRMLVGLRALADIGSLPGLASGLGAVLGVESGRWRLEGEAEAWLPRLAIGGATKSQGGDIGLYSAGVRACWDKPQSRGTEGRLTRA